MRVPPLVVGLACAFLAATVLAPSVAAKPAGNLERALYDPFGLFWDQVPDEHEPPVPEPVANNGVYHSGFCYFSSELSFCVDDLQVLPKGNGSVEGNATSEEAPASALPEEPEAAPGEAPADEPSLLPLSEELDPASPEPRAAGPEPQVEVPPEEAPGAQPTRDQASVPGVNWAVVTAAITLPWAIGLKILATLLGLRRASRLAGGEDGRPSLRDAVLETVAGEPGIRHSDLVARIGRGNGTVEHHVHTLLAAGRLARVRGLGSTLYFPAGALAEGEARMRLSLQGRTSRLMAQAVAARPGIRLGELARELGVSGATAHYQAGKLVRAGILRQVAGTGRRLAVAEQALPVVAALAAGPSTAPPQGQAWAPNATSA